MVVYLTEKPAFHLVLKDLVELLQQAFSDSTQKAGSDRLKKGGK